MYKLPAKFGKLGARKLSRIFNEDIKKPKENEVCLMIGIKA
jgi:hypothetical protein